MSSKTKPTQPGGVFVAGVSSESAEANVRRRFSALLSRIAKHLTTIPAGAPTKAIGTFVRCYYANIALEDLEERTPGDLAGAVTAHANLAAQRLDGQVLVQVINPETETHGWRSAHTVIDLVCDDRPFLVDALRIVLARRNIGILLLVHPVVDVVRDPSGTLLGFGANDGRPESWMHVEVQRQIDPRTMHALQRELFDALSEATAAADDADSMRNLALELAASLPAETLPVTDGEVSEAVTFLEWLTEGNFQFLGYRKYEIANDARGVVLRAVKGSGLGLLRESVRAPKGNRLLDMPPDMRRRFERAELVIVTKDLARSTVLRNEYFDYIGVKIFDRRGRVIGEHRFLGLFDMGVFRRSVLDIAPLHAKVQSVIRASGLSLSSYRGRELLDTLEAFPRDDMFQISAADLERIAIGITNLQERKQIALFARRDGFGRFLSCLVYVPREQFSTEIAEEIGEMLCEAYGGRSTEIEHRITDRILARVHVRIQLGDEARTDVDEQTIESRIGELTRRWVDDFQEELIAVYGEAVGVSMFHRSVDVFSEAYRGSYTAHVAVGDLQRVGLLSPTDSLVTELCKSEDAGPNEWRFKVYTSGAALPLSAMLPLLDNLGLIVVDERPNELRFGDGAWLHDIGVIAASGSNLADPAIGDELQATFRSIWRNEVENDGFNRLVVTAGLTNRQVVVLRAYSRYLRQVGNSFTPSYIESTLGAHPQIARLLVELFDAKFDPARGSLTGVERDTASIESLLLQALDAVSSLDEDRILRSFLALITATLRTNTFRAAYAPDAPTSSALSFKLNPELVPDLPLPKPLFEIWVYSPRVEGIHLRGGRIARGGLRWSDRREDFRTEVLGLMKAQMVKNSVIVPVGAKGGFVVKQQPVEPLARKAEVVACYQTFVGALLDVTDNRVAGAVVAPPGVVRYDDDDTYLVVAADKGTATFSDTANAVSAAYGFWLGDAFASGGSVGYDHKAMAITARGAWESVRRHFRTLGRNADLDPITVAGIGDMSGDVFGNGMLLSSHMKLIAAFDHRHIFIDPNPDPSSSFAERQRMFALPGSSWDNYDKSLISKGGGVFPRSAKAISISAEARSALHFDRATATPIELIRAILEAPVDLLWNGGIGTYAKATPESNADVGDRSNDSVRIDASQLRCTVVVEGGNLGFTQRARIEFALAGGLINTDAIDNSAGVDCSDHEVNIKVAFDRIVAAGELTNKQRNSALAAMTSEVAELVLDDNRAQNLALAIARHQGAMLTNVHARQIRALELTGEINRRVEFLPDDKELTERITSGKGLTTPELAVLLAYTKESAADAILRSSVPDNAFLRPSLHTYFPSLMRRKFSESIAQHPLRREIVATAVANTLVNRAGLSFVHRSIEETSATVEEIVTAYVVADAVFDIARLWESVDAASPKLTSADEIDLFLSLRRLSERAVLWFLRNRRAPMDISSTVDAFRPGVGALTSCYHELVYPCFGHLATKSSEPPQTGGSSLPETLARQVTVWPYLHTALDIVKLATDHVADPTAVGSLYWAIFGQLELVWMWEEVANLPRTDRWLAQARSALREDLLLGIRDLTSEVLSTPGRLPGWMERNAAALARATVVWIEVRAQGVFNASTLTVALRQLRTLATK